jgi:hypothetical protein
MSETSPFFSLKTNGDLQRNSQLSCDQLVWEVVKDNDIHILGCYCVNPLRADCGGCAVASEIGNLELKRSEKMLE